VTRTRRGVRSKVQAAALGRAVQTVEGLRARSGIIGRVARAFDDEINVRYLAERVEAEGALIDRFVGARPAGTERVSLVVPVFGIPLPYLKEFVESIHAQTYDAWEVCFCDDGDDNREVTRYLKQLSESSRRFRVTRHPTNLGIATATRTALGLATGTLIGFADEDDLLHPRALEAVTSVFASDADVEFVYTDNDHASDLGHRRAPIRKPEWSPELLQCVNYVNHFVAVRRSFLARCPDLFAPSVSGGQDWDLALQAARTARKTAAVPLPLYHWRKRPGSIAEARDAKPWVKDACHRVRTRHLRAIDPRLTLSPADGCAPQHYHLEPDLADDAELPRVTVLALDAPAPATWRPYTPDYGGWIKVVHRLTAGAATNQELLSLLLREVRAAESDHLFIVDARRLQPAGSLRRLMAFAIQPGVGCVWPFFDAARRLCYTVGTGSELTQLVRHKDIFHRFSGNVLSGPMHALLADRRALLAAGDFLGSGSETFLKAARHDDALGAALGLAARAGGLRNVACRGMRCETDLADVRVPPELVPRRDPYA
jgi:hypothetical protein